MGVITLIGLNHVAYWSTLQQDRACPTEWQLRTIRAFKFGSLWVKLHAVTSDWCYKAPQINAMEMQKSACRTVGPAVPGGRQEKEKGQVHCELSWSSSLPAHSSPSLYSLSQGKTTATVPNWGLVWFLFLFFNLSLPLSMEERPRKKIYSQSGRSPPNTPCSNENNTFHFHHISHRWSRKSNSFLFQSYSPKFFSNVNWITWRERTKTSLYKPPRLPKSTLELIDDL